jgi:hypothetical protein
MIGRGFGDELLQAKYRSISPSMWTDLQEIHDVRYICSQKYKLPT